MRPKRSKFKRPRIAIDPADVRALYHVGLTHKQIALKLGCSTTKIWYMLNGKLITKDHRKGK